jgi:ferric-dicitrate binding protein FerR (iron transport regulator)
MSCFQTESELVDLLDGRLDAARELAVHAHLEGCADCRRRAEEWRRLVPVMRGLAPPPLAPLRARRMELEIERLVAEPKARDRAPSRRAFAWGGVAVAAAAAFLLIARWRGSHGPALVSPLLPVRVTSVVGVAHVGAVAMRAGTLLDAGGELSVDLAGAATLEVAGASLKLDGPARLALAGDAAHVALDLPRGTLTAKVAHRAPGATFVVSTGQGRVEVRGTRFVVHSESDASTVAVDEGRVAVFSRAGVERAVSAGERVALDATGFVERAPAPSTEAPSLAPAGAGLRPCAPAGPSCEVTASQARASMRAGDAARALRLVEGAMASRLDCADAAASSGCHDELRYLRAEALRQDGRLEAAVAAYKALDAHGAPAAMRQNAFYAAAQLEQRLGRSGAARADFERALAAAPKGALREEALLGAMESAAAAGESRRAAALAARYLASFPAGLGAARARALSPADR